MVEQIRLRRDTAANWTAANPVLASGEPGYETDTKKRKLGDGITAWSALAYQETAAGTTFAPAGNIAATDVQAALTELDAEKTSLTHLGVTGAGCLAYQSTAQLIQSGTDTSVVFASELFDTAGYHDNVTNNSRLTVPAGKGGTYLIAGGIRFATNGTGVRLIYLLQNGVTILGSSSAAPPSSYPATPTFSFLAPLAAGDYIQSMAYQDSGGALSTNVTLGMSTFLSIYRIGD